MTKTKKIIISVVAIAVLFGLYVAFDRQAKNREINNLTVTSTTSTTTNPGVSVNMQATGNYKIEQVPIIGGQSAPQPIPNLSTKVVFDPDLSLTPEVKQMVLQKISTLQAVLLKNPSDFDSWINLGIYQKMAGDYQATIVSWQYAGKLSPTNFISFGDLGDLYAYFLKDTTQSEKYYKQAIVNGPTQAYLYIQLAQVYRDIMLDSAKAATLIDQGLSKIPNDPSLLQFKASLK